MSLLRRIKTSVKAPPPTPTCKCTYTLLGGGPYMSEYEERNDNPKCPVHHPEDK